MEHAGLKYVPYLTSDVITCVQFNGYGPRIPAENAGLLHKRLKQRRCPYCKSDVAVDCDIMTHTPYTTPAVDIFAQVYGHRTSLPARFRALTTCVKCNWWSYFEDGLYEDDDGPNAEYDYIFALHWGKIIEFDTSDMRAPVEALRKYISRKPEILYGIHPKSLEHIVRSCFSDFFDCEAIHVGGPGDGGVDVVLLDGDNPTLVQVKRRSNPKSVESVSVVRELLGSLITHDRYSGIIVSTANRFSRMAVKESSIPVLRDKNLKLTLYNYDALDDVG